MGTKLNKLVIKLNNLIRGRKKRKFSPEKVMILFSHCLQNSKCPQKIVLDLANCKRCGKCVVAHILEMGEHYKVNVAVASGSEMALEKVRARKLDAIIAIACEKELAGGIKALLPQRVLAITNTKPYGPCKDCNVDVTLLEKFLKRVLRPA